MCQCEDRPCCGHLAEERADDAYWAERAYSGEDYYSEDDYEEEDDEYSEDDDCLYGREDSALESSLFGDC
jgi:hypothetical protein